MLTTLTLGTLIGVEASTGARTTQATAQPGAVGVSAPVSARGGVIAMLRVAGIGDFRFDGGELVTKVDVRTTRVDGDTRLKRAGEAKRRVTLRRSLALGGEPVEGWFDDAAREGIGRAAVVAFYDTDGNELRVYALEGVYPMSLSVNDRDGLGAWGEEIVLEADAIRRVR